MSALARAIGAANVVVATRNVDSAPATAFKALGVSVIAGDFNDVESLKAAFTGARAVYLIAPGTEVGCCCSASGAAAGAGVLLVCVWWC